MFTKAITRKPCKALIDGITTAMFGEGTPDYETAIKQHDNYVETLRGLGLEVLDLEADERYPDSCFVEDPAVVMAECAIITNPATDSRNGEKYEIVDAIKKFYSDETFAKIAEATGAKTGDLLQGVVVIIGIVAALAVVVKFPRVVMVCGTWALLMTVSS